MMQVNSTSLSSVIPLSQSYLNSQIETTLPEQSTPLGHTWSPKQSNVNDEDLKTNQVAEEILETHSLNNNTHPVSLKKEPELLQNFHLIHSSSNDSSSSSERISSQDTSDRIGINSPRFPKAVSVNVVPLNSENTTSQSPSTLAVNPENSIQQLAIERELRNESEIIIHSQTQRAQPSILATNGRTYTCTFNCFSNNAFNSSRGFGHYLIPATVVAGIAGITGAVLIANATNDDEKLAGQILTPVGFVGFAIGTVSAILRAAIND